MIGQTVGGDGLQTILLVLFVSYLLVGIISARLGVLALRARRGAARPQATLWSYFALIGGAGTVTGIIGCVNQVTTTALAVVESMVLGVVILIALAMREGYYSTILSNAETDRIGEFQLRRGFELVCVLLVPTTALGRLWSDHIVFSLALAAAGVAAVGYGIYFQQRRTGAPAARGTVIDTLLRQAVPALVFGGGIAMTPALTAGPRGDIISTTVTIVFTIMLAGSLLTVSIKLNQHVLTQG